jgi:hypothetical protein
MLIDTHAQIDLQKPVADLIDENAVLTVRLQKQQATQSANYPSYGQFAEPADRSTLRPFDLAELEALEEFGDLFLEAQHNAGSIGNWNRWQPGVFAVRVASSEGVTAADPSHFAPDGLELLKSPGLGSLHEVGVGQLHIRRGEVQEAISVVLRRLVLGGEEVLSARAYMRPGIQKIDRMIADVPLPDEDLCQAFLQLQRNAMWRSVTKSP